MRREALVAGEGGGGLVGLLSAVAMLNELRRTRPDDRRLAELEAKLSGRFGMNQRLATYGSLAPGGPHHASLAGLSGEWRTSLFARGCLRAAGWGAALGFPGFVWDEQGESIAVSLLTSAELPALWSGLDAFEGSDYRRIVVLLHAAPAPPAAALANRARLLTLANIYALAA
jgi:gamma-glutamylcyclotransferase (GGCT)/AIG2-like uncharacterized protein YtfP